MDHEKNLMEMEYAIRKKVTSREEFLHTMNYIIPWAEWIDYIRPFVPQQISDDQQVSLLLRMYLLQKWFSLDDSKLSDTIYDSYAMWLFMGNGALEGAMPQPEVYSAFKDALEQSNVGATLSESIDNFLHRYGRKMTYRPVMEVTIESIDAADNGFPRSAARTAPQAPPPPVRQTAYAPEPSPKPEDDVLQIMEARVRQLEEAQKAERVKTPPMLDEPDAFDDFNELPRERRNGFGRFLLILLLLLLVGGIAVVVYDHAQTGVWLRWIPSLAPASTIMPDATASLTPAAQLVPPSSAEATDTPTPLFVRHASDTPTLAQEQYAAMAESTSTYAPLPYEARAEITAAQAKLASNPTPAAVVNEKTAQGKKILLTLDGMYEEEETMLKLLDILAQFDTDVMFFPSGLQTADYPQILSAIHEAGHEVGSYTLRAMEGMERLSSAKLVEDFVMARKIITVETGTAPQWLKLHASEATADVLAAAGASGHSQLLESTAYVTYQSFINYDQALAYVNRMPYGSIISVNLSGELSASEYTPKEIIERPAIDKEASTEAEISAVDGLSESERLLLVVQWLMQAMDEASFSPESVAMRQDNQGVMAEPIKQLRTTQPAVAYIFNGDYSNEAEVASVLQSLKKLQGHGTFFISQETLDNHADILQAILLDGHSLGLSPTLYASQDFYAVCHQLLTMSHALEARYGYTPRTVLNPGSENLALSEAAAATNMLLVAADISFMREETMSARDPQTLIDNIYGDNLHGFERGKIVRFRLGYQEDASIAGKLLLALEGTRNAYAITDVYEMATSTDHLYTYPLTADQILPEVYNKIYPGQLTATDDTLFSLIKSRYIGNPDINDKKRLPGFTSDEISVLDTKGKISGIANTVYFTFDDWGTDVSITKLLDVLRKHDVKATFFVRTEYVPINPNLLRAIAMEGHEIASHTHTHLPLANTVENTWIFEELTEEQLNALREDVQTSWDVLQSIVGDIRLENGAPALSTLFRPPTLAVSKSAIAALLDMGFTYIVNGQYTTQDYKAASAIELRRNLRLNIWEGTIVIMHFSDNAIYTADALDEYLTLNASGQNRTIYQFARLSDYLRKDDSIGYE